MRRPLAVLVVASLMMLFFGGVATANGGPPSLPGDRGGVVLPGSTDQVHVRREQLRFDVADDLKTATVTARYELENRGGALPNFPVIFVIQDARRTAADAHISWNGQPLSYQQLDLSSQTPDEIAQMFRAWSGSTTLVDPATNKPYEDQRYVWSKELGYLAFALNLDAGAKGTLEVTYRHTAGWNKTRYTHIVYDYQYLLLPAKSWASFGPLEIRVKAPGPSEVFFGSTLPLRWENGEYRGDFPGLPDQNLSFSLMSRKGIVGKVTKSGPYYWATFVLALLAAGGVGWGIGRLAGRLRSRGWSIAVGIVAGLVVGGLLDLGITFGFLALMPALENLGYDYLFIGIGQWLVAVLVTTALAGVVAGRQTKS